MTRSIPLWRSAGAELLLDTANLSAPRGGFAVAAFAMDRADRIEGHRSGGLRSDLLPHLPPRGAIDVGSGGAPCFPAVAKLMDLS
jgi:hypothetical protein